MQNIVLKIVLILAVVGLCTLALASKKVRLGKDLRGGTSLIYRVTIPEDADREAVIAQTIEVLKDRVNPTGVLDISFQPLGLDRIEVVMPLPNEAVRALNDVYKTALRDLLERSSIVASDLELALQQGSAVERYCTGDGTGPRCTKVRELADAHRALTEAQTELQSARESGADVATIAVRENAVAETELRHEALFEEALGLSLDRSRMVRALGLATEQDPILDAQGRHATDPATGEELYERSPRDVAIDAIKGDFPYVADDIDAVVAAYDTYQSERTGLDDPEDLIRLLRGAGVLQFHIAVNPTDHEGVPLEDLRRQIREVGPENVDRTVAAWFPINDLKQWYDGPDQLAALQANPSGFFASRGLVVEETESGYYMLLYNLPSKRLTHSDGQWQIRRTFPSPDQLGRPAVSFQLDPSGGTLMAKLTGAHVGEPMAIVLDGEIYSAPTLQSQISASGIITGNFSQAEISYLIRVLAAGSLEARLSPDPIAVNTLGPTIGADNLRRGSAAFVIAIIAVAVFMLVYYFFAGFVADIALLANGLIIFGGMAMIDGTFTLPGLAGIVLTIGMAVDANVLIYERIREELFAGEEDLRGAIRLGYAKALSTIIDANVTNLIICLVLFKTATAEVKGFALTLTIGICATLFTALFVTRVIFTLYTDLFHVKKLSMLPTVVPAIHRALEPAIDWVRLRGIFWVVSAIAVAASIVIVLNRGVDMFDTEFRGGVTATMITAPVDEDGDGAPDIGADGVERRWLTQPEVESRLRAVSEGVDPDAAADDAERQRRLVLREFRNAAVLTSGATREQDGETAAQAFQIKVANPKGLGDETATTDIVVNAIVDVFGDSGEIDIQPRRAFAGSGEDAAGHVRPIDEPVLGRVVDEPSLAGVRVPDFLGGVAMVVRDIEPPITIAELEGRLERMRNQPDYASTVGRRTRIVGLDAVDPNRPARGWNSVVMLALEPNLSAMKVDSDVWYEQFAAPEWRLLTAALDRQSSLQQVSSFSSAVAETLAANAVVAVVLSLLGILLYIWIRFGSLRYSAAAIAALVHDVCIALGLLGLTGLLSRSAIGQWLLVEEFRIDLGVVAALLTIIGYSLNDTIVILDRIRENRGKRPIPTAAIVNRSINQTVSRTLLTTVTTLMAVLIMYVEGGSGIRPFTYCLLVGLVVGTYSSVAIAAPLVIRRTGGPKEMHEEVAEASSTGAPVTV